MAFINTPIEVVDYNLERFWFRDMIREHLNIYDLSRLHELVETEGVFKRENDQSTWAHKRFYEIGNVFHNRYRDFIQSFVRPMFDEDVVFQRIPTFRVHLPGNVAVGEFHRDTRYHHGESAVNFWLPLTRTWETNSVSILYNKKYIAPELKVGQVLIFDGTGLYHGNAPNITGKTRVSFDFRVVPKSKFVPSDEVTVNTGVKMNVGGYYDTF